MNKNYYFFFSILLMAPLFVFSSREQHTLVPSILIQYLITEDFIPELEQAGLTDQLKDLKIIPSGMRDLILKRVPLEIVEQSVTMAKDIIRSYGIKYVPESFDCDNFRELFQTCLHATHSKTNAHAEALAFPATVMSEDSVHAITIVSTDHGWVAVDLTGSPQIYPLGTHLLENNFRLKIILLPVPTILYTIENKDTLIKIGEEHMRLYHERQTRIHYNEL